MTNKATAVLTVINFTILTSWLASRSPAAQLVPLPVLRGSALELVDDRGRVRVQVTVEPSGETVLRLRDERGHIRVKLGASQSGSGLLLLDDATEPGVQVVAGRSAAQGQGGTGITLTAADGRRRHVAP